MTHIISAKNVNHALSEGLHWLRVAGEVNDSRNGAVLVAPGPVITQTYRPTERVLFSELRDANPFFHLMEALWMLAGRNDVAMPATYAAQMRQYSDNGSTLHGAYGYRWRVHNHTDQIHATVAELRRDKLSRRCVIAMWDPSEDLRARARGGKDLPCNTHIYFDASRGQLDMTVCCRSNDAVWGAHGANAVHFSVLQELIALSVGVPVGIMYQLSNNYHAYIERPDVQRLYDRDSGVMMYEPCDLYAKNRLTVTPLMGDDNYLSFLAQVSWFCDGEDDPKVLTQPFLRDVAVPLRAAHEAYRAGNYDIAYEHVGGIAADDWSIACRQWLERRQAKAVMLERQRADDAVLYANLKAGGEGKAPGSVRSGSDGDAGVVSYNSRAPAASGYGEVRIHEGNIPLGEESEGGAS